jgi:hypothetical protein
VAEPDLLTDGVPDRDAEDDAEDDGATDREGDGDGDGDGDLEGDGEGDVLACTGSAWHDELVAGLAVAVLAGRDAACAGPAMPKVRKLPLSNIAVATRACPECISTACLR